jgi:hypothetical protein
VRRLFLLVSVAPFELAIALLLVLSGVRYLWREDELAASQIGQTLPVPEIWATGYLLAGALMLLGILRPHAKTEAAGLALMTSVVTINAIAFVATYDVWEQWAYGVAFVFYLSLAVAGIARLCVLLAGPLIVAGGRSGSS